MNNYRNCTPEEYELFMENIPYAIEDDIKEIYSIDVPYDIFNPEGMPTRIMFKGVPNAEEIIKDGRLRLSKCHQSGWYGKGIYCADDVTYAKSYGNTVLILEVIDDFAEYLTEVKSSWFDEDQQKEFIENAKKNHIGYYASDFGADQHENEYIITNENAVRIRGIIKIN